MIYWDYYLHLATIVFDPSHIFLCVLFHKYQYMCLNHVFGHLPIILYTDAIFCYYFHLAILMYQFHVFYLVRISQGTLVCLAKYMCPNRALSLCSISQCRYLNWTIEAFLCPQISHFWIVHCIQIHQHNDNGQFLLSCHGCTHLHTRHQLAILLCQNHAMYLCPIYRCICIQSWQ